MFAFCIFIGLCLAGVFVLGQSAFMIIDIIYQLITKRNLRIDIKLATGGSMDEIRMLWDDAYLVKHGYL